MPSRIPIEQRTNRGFTLLEVLVAVVVLTTGLILALQGITAGLAASSRSSRRAAAQAVAADMLNSAVADAVAVPAAGRENRDGTEYDWRLRRDTTSVKPVMVTCHVEWLHRGVTHTISLSRLWEGP